MKLKILTILATFHRNEVIFLLTLVVQAGIMSENDHPHAPKKTKTTAPVSAFRKSLGNEVNSAYDLLCLNP